MSTHITTESGLDPRPGYQLDPLRLAPAPGMEIVDLYAAEAVSANALTSNVPSEFAPFPATGGVRFRLVTLPPDPVGHLHSTPTVDLVTVVSGEIWLADADGAEAALTTGDTVVLRGSEHAWRNHSQEPALLSVVLLGTAQD